MDPKNTTSGGKQIMAETKTEKLRVSLETPLPFDAVTKSKFMSPADLCKLANNLFKSVFVDYVGCGININTPASNAGVVQFASVDGLVNDVPQNAYYLNLFFQDLGVTADPDSGQYNALSRLHGNSKVTGGGLSAAFDSFTETRSNPHQYALTAEAKELLEDFVFTVPYQQKLPKEFWARHVFEFQQNNGYFSMNKPSIHVGVRGIDINKVINHIYAKLVDGVFVDDQGDPVEYQTMFYVPPTFGRAGSDLIVKIDQLDRNTFRNFVDGMYSGSIMSNSYIPAR